VGKAQYQRFEGGMGLSGASPAQRLRTVLLLSQLPAPMAGPVLKMLLKDPNPWVRRRAEQYRCLIQPPAKSDGVKYRINGGSDVIREGTVGGLVTLLQQLPPPALVVDAGQCSVLLNQQPVLLTAAEFRLLLTLARHQGSYVTKETLYGEAVNDHGAGENNSALKNLIKKLRHKLGDNGQNPTLIKCLRNYGYCLNGTVTVKIQGDTVT